MAELKTQKNDDSVDDFIAGIEDDRKRADSKTLLEMMGRITGDEPSMWGPSIIGVGDQQYKYASGREGDWFKIGFSPRKQNLTLYVTDYISEDDPLFPNWGSSLPGRPASTSSVSKTSRPTSSRSRSSGPSATSADSLSP